jgi:hypothetical protein
VLSLFNGRFIEMLKINNYFCLEIVLFDSIILQRRLQSTFHCGSVYMYKVLTDFMEEGLAWKQEAGSSEVRKSY